MIKKFRRWWTYKKKKRKLKDEEEKIEVNDTYEKLKESENLKQKDFGSLGLQFKIKDQDSFEKAKKALFWQGGGYNDKGKKLKDQKKREVREQIKSQQRKLLIRQYLDLKKFEYMLEQSSETIDDILFQAKHPTEQTIKKNDKKWIYGYGIRYRI